MQCYKVANLQHLIVAECHTSSFQADLIPIVRYFITVLIICYISSAQQNASHAHALTLQAICLKYKGMINYMVS